MRVSNSNQRLFFHKGQHMVLNNLQKDTVWPWFKKVSINVCHKKPFSTMYQIGLKGMQWWHGFVMYSEVVSVKDGKHISPPLEVALNRNNINKVEATLFNTYKYHTTGSLYDVARKCLFWSLDFEVCEVCGESLMTNITQCHQDSQWMEKLMHKQFSVIILLMMLHFHRGIQKLELWGWGWGGGGDYHFLGGSWTPL